jgi:hypothetical protein
MQRHTKPIHTVRTYISRLLFQPCLRVGPVRVLPLPVAVAGVGFVEAGEFGVGREVLEEELLGLGLAFGQVLDGFGEGRGGG